MSLSFPFKTALAAALTLALTSAPASAAADAPNSEAAAKADAKLAEARAGAAAKRWKEAAAGFRDVAMTAPATEAGRSAVKPYFEALDGLASDDVTLRPAVLDTMARDAALLVRLHCASDVLANHPEPCLTLLFLRKDLETHRAPSLVGDVSTKELAAQAEREIAVWKDGGAALCLARRPGCDRMAPVLKAAADALSTAGKRTVALRILEDLTSPRYGLEATLEAKSALHSLGALHEDLAAHDIAAGYYERFAEASAGAESAPSALERAVELRLQLGDRRQALADAERFAKRYDVRRASGLGRIALLLAEEDTRESAWKEVRKRLDAVAGRVDSGASVDVKILVHARLGRASVELGDTRRAAVEFASVERAWKNPEEAERQITEGASRNAPATATMVNVLTAVGEAIFFRVEQERAEALRAPLPAYRGPDTREGFIAFIRTTLTPWMTGRRKAIEAMEVHYTAVLAIKPVAPPKWVVASASRVGFMWSDFVAALKSIPLTPEAKRTGPIPGGNGVTYEDVRALYESTIESSSEPFLRRAKDAFNVCVQTSKRYRHSDAISRGCERWLAKTYPREFHAVDELFREPSLLAAPFVGRPATPE